MGSVHRFFRIEAFAVISYRNPVKVCFPNGRYRHQAVLFPAHAVADGVFHQRLDGQRRNIKVIVLDMVFNMDAWKPQRFDLRIQPGMLQLL